MSLSLLQTQPPSSDFYTNNIQPHKKTVTLAASSGLNDTEIEKMILEAESHAEADKKRKDVIEESNKAESIMHDTEKAMADFKEQLEKESADKIRPNISELCEYVAQGPLLVMADTGQGRGGCMGGGGHQPLLCLL